MSDRVDLTDIPVVDNHCHPVLARQDADPATWRGYFTESPDPGFRAADAMRERMPAANEDRPAIEVRVMTATTHPGAHRPGGPAAADADVPGANGNNHGRRSADR